ncbi:ATP-binding protein [Streptomyces sp. SID3212]|uniref:ATP-binding protein n=1 Tax=Streptomyces sp. SID3212 TaxID=2690259 RepID=UPI001F2E63B1|nr:ATP-binding protein [Streptomyces sp. SID3212]
MACHTDAHHPKRTRAPAHPRHRATARPATTLGDDKMTLTATALAPPQGGETYRLAVPNTASAPKIARDFVGYVLLVSRHDVLLDDAQLCVTEVVTNAHRHTCTQLIRVTVTINRKQVTVSVVDDKPWALPVPQRPHPTCPPHPAYERSSGQGLLLVETLANAWGATIHGGVSPTTKAVWFTLTKSAPA